MRGRWEKDRRDKDDQGGCFCLCCCCFRMCAGLIAVLLALKHTHTHTHTWLSPWYKCTEHNGGAVFLVSKRKQCGQRTNDRVREKVGVVYRSTCVREHRGTAVPDSLEKSAFIKLLRRCSEKITHTHTHTCLFSEDS